jgi:nucleoside-diphosphate-sugar epimerase
MKILMIGGTGNISTAVSELLVRQGHSLHLLCMDIGAHRNFHVDGAEIHLGDVNDEVSVLRYLYNQSFDVIVDWTIMEPEQVKRDIRLFTGKTSQYIFISTSSVYQKPSKHYIITENTPLENPFWEYSRKKIACEKLLMEAYKSNAFPVTIVRPSLTYGDTIIPYVLVSWVNPWSLIDRLLKGKRVIVPGDGTSLWTITHNTDFAKGITGLMGKEKAIGEAFHITSDEVLTWDDILNQIAQVVGVEAKAVHISSEFITSFIPDQLGNLNGDKSISAVFDNSKLKSLYPDFKATTSFHVGFTQTYNYFLSHPELHTVDVKFEDDLDRVIEAYDYGLSFLRKN